MSGAPIYYSPKARAPITPRRSGVVTAEVALNGDLTTATDQPIIGLRVIADPGDDIAAANALLTGVGCKVVQPGDSIFLEASAAMVALYVVGIGNAAIPADYTGGLGVISINETDVTDAQAQMIRFDFSSLDVVKSATIQLSSTWASGLAARVFVEGYSHA